MKFNKQLTSVKSALEGIEQYEAAFRSGTLRKIVLQPSGDSSVPGLWEKFSLHTFSWKEATSHEPLEVLAMRIRPRSLVIDELTRHPNTDQVFIPVTAPFLAVVGGSLQSDIDHPAPDSLAVVPVSVGEAINVKAGTWHTLPFAMLQDIVCISVMRRNDLDSYHDLRDLVAAGWFAVPSWPDPESIH